MPSLYTEILPGVYVKSPWLSEEPLNNVCPVLDVNSYCCTARDARIDTLAVCLEEP